MEFIETYIYDDLKHDIKNVGYSVIKLNLERQAYTDPNSPFIFYNMKGGDLFSLTEEYFHALKKHHRLYDYDVLNKDESEAHGLALKYLFDKWCKYVGVNDWLQFSEAMGVPNEHFNTVIDMFTPLTIEQAQL